MLCLHSPALSSTQQMQAAHALKCAAHIPNAFAMSQACDAVLDVCMPVAPVHIKRPRMQIVCARTHDSFCSAGFIDVVTCCVTSLLAYCVTAAHWCLPRGLKSVYILRCDAGACSVVQHASVPHITSFTDLVQLLLFVWRTHCSVQYFQSVLTEHCCGTKLRLPNPALQSTDVVCNDTFWARSPSKHDVTLMVCVCLLNSHQEYCCGCQYNLLAVQTG